MESQKITTKSRTKRVEFEIFGKVQGVYFRKFTQAKAKSLSLGGWVMNTARGTVVGCVEGPQETVETMVHWLRTTGSPRSKILNANFTNVGTSEKMAKEFVIRK